MSTSLLGCGDFETSETEPGAEGSDLSADGQPPVAVLIEPGTAVVQQGDTVGFNAVAIYANGDKRTVTEAAAWSCSNPDVMEVSNSGDTKGMGTAVAPGTSTMRIRTSSGIQAEAAIEVVRSPEDIEADIRRSLPVDLYPSVPMDVELYADAANPVHFEATNMGDSYTVNLENVEGGVVGSGEEANSFILSPSASQMSFDVVVDNGDRSERFGDLSYGSRDVPGPKVELINVRRGQEVDRGIDATDITDLQLEAVSDQDFQADHPEDSAVRISEVKVTLERDSGTSIIRTFSSGNIDLYDFRTAASPGDNLYIEINGVQRQNYREEVVEHHNYYPHSFYVPLK